MELVFERFLREFRSSFPVTARVVMVQDLNFYVFVHSGKIRTKYGNEGGMEFLGIAVNGEFRKAAE